VLAGTAGPGGDGTGGRPATAAYGNGGTPAPGAGYRPTGPQDPRGVAVGSNGYGGGSQDQGRPAIRIPAAPRHPEGAGAFGTTGGYGAGTAPGPAEPGARRGRHGTEDVPVVTGVPVGRPPVTPPPDFDVFTPIRRADQDGSAADGAYPRPYPDFGGAGADPYVSPYGAPEVTPYREDSPAFPDSANPGGNGPYGESGAYGNEATFGNNGDSPGSYESEDVEVSGDGDFKGLPRRVRQANLAPQLRASAAAAAGPQGPAAVPPATAASLTDMRNTLSAMQRGWQQGRSQKQRDTED
jgi:hypothetical protein